MSSYHAECSKPFTKDKNKGANRTQPKLTTKPFCDCNSCECKDCPDILKMFSITVTENSCRFGPKVGKDCKVCKSEMEHSKSDEIAKLLENITQNAECGCEVIARAVASDPHASMGLYDFQTRKKNDDSSTEK